MANQEPFDEKCMEMLSQLRAERILGSKNQRTRRIILACLRSLAAECPIPGEEWARGAMSSCEHSWRSSHPGMKLEDPDDRPWETKASYSSQGKDATIEILKQERPMQRREICEGWKETGMRIHATELKKKVI